MPISFDKAFGIARDLKAFLNPQSSITRRMSSEQRERIESKRRELFRVQRELSAAKDGAERSKHKKRKKRIQQEIFELTREFRAAEEQGAEATPDGRTTPRATDESAVGALPDFFIIGAKKCGTTFLYHLLGQHPHVEAAKKKEIHYFDHHFSKGNDWYRSHFPPPTWKEGRRSITGESSPYYLFHPHAARRMAGVVPRARLIVLLRNPVDRAYSHYHQEAGRGHEPLTFEEAIEAEEARLRGERDRMLEHEH